MISNMAECFNSVLKGVRALPVTAIVQYTFDKLREYFLHYSEETDKQIAGENKKKKTYKYPPLTVARVSRDTTLARSRNEGEETGKATKQAI